jgi:hypothetical protein
MVLIILWSPLRASNAAAWAMEQGFEVACPWIFFMALMMISKNDKKN